MKIISLKLETSPDTMKIASCHFRAYVPRKSAEMQSFYLSNGHHFPRSRSFEVIFPNKAPLTSRNVPSKFHWNKQDRFGEKCKHENFLFKKIVISQGQGYSRSSPFLQSRQPQASCMSVWSFCARIEQHTHWIRLLKPSQTHIDPNFM